jgi:hypothetical protein
MKRVYMKRDIYEAGIYDPRSLAKGVQDPILSCLPDCSSWHRPGNGASSSTEASIALSVGTPLCPYGIAYRAVDAHGSYTTRYALGRGAT